MVIVSIKGYEKEPSEWKIKARIVFRGDAVRDQDGLAATFQGLQSSAPSSIAGVNVVMAYSMIDNFLHHFRLYSALCQVAQGLAWASGIKCSLDFASGQRVEKQNGRQGI